MSSPWAIDISKNCPSVSIYEGRVTFNLPSTYITKASVSKK